MIPSPLFPSRHQMAMLVAALGLVLLAAQAAHAFTFEDKTVTNSDGTRSSITDPASRFGSGGDAPGTIRQGNTTFQFGAGPGPGRGSMDQRFNNSSDRMFNPLGRPGEDR